VLRFLVHDGVSPGFLTARSAWGDPGTWEVDLALDRDTPVDADSMRFMQVVSWTPTLRLGADILLGLGALRTSRSWVTPPWFLSVAPEPEAGAFDAGAGRAVALLEDECDPPSAASFCGRFYYTGSYDVPSLEEAGWGHARIRLASVAAP
jgi:hypothetical protein